MAVIVVRGTTGRHYHMSCTSSDKSVINAEKLKALYAEGYRDAEANYELLLNYLES